MSIDWGKLIDREQAMIANIPDMMAGLAGKRGTVFHGTAKFTGPNTVEVDGRAIHFKKAVITTGARALHPDIPGLENAGFLTNETVFNLTELPERLIVIGGGPIGCELAQAFRRLGSNVTIIERTRFLPREDPEASAILAESFKRDGIEVLQNAFPALTIEALPVPGEVMWSVVNLSDCLAFFDHPRRSAFESPR